MNDDLDALLTDLAEAATRAAAHGTLGDTAPAAVHRITARVRRRRAVRHTGQGVAVACAAGALVAGGAHVQDVLRSPTTTGPSVSADGPLDLPFSGVTSELDGPVTSLGSPAPTAGPRASASDLESDVATGRAQADAQAKQHADEEARVEQELRAAEHGPAATVFRCGEPVHTTIHTRPDAHGLLLAADDDLTAVVTGVAQDTWHADLPAAARYALLGPDGTVVGRLVEDDDATTRVDGTRPEQQYRLHGALHVVGCPDQPDVTSGEKLVAWPYVSAGVYSSASDTTATAVVVIAEPREITVPSAASRTAG